MFKEFFFEECSVFLEHFYDDLVCIFDKHTFKVFCFGDKLASFIDHLYKRQIVLSAHSAIIFTKGRCDVDNACAICQCDVVIVDNVVCFLLCASFVCEKWLVFCIFIFLALFERKFFITAFFKEFCNKCICKDIFFIAHCDFCIVFVGIHTECNV